LPTDRAIAAPDGDEAREERGRRRPKSTGRHWFPFVTLELIYEKLAGEPWCYLPEQIEKLDRDTVFERYLRPRKRKRKQKAMSMREAFFTQARIHGKSWLEIESVWQQQQKALQTAMKQERERASTNRGSGDSRGRR
jgi:hypothetical protein